MTRRLWLGMLAPLAFCLAQEDAVAKIDRYLSENARLEKFMGTALVAKGGKILLEKGYGMANIELEIPNAPKHKFRLGSITKQFTATAILQLQEQGKLNVNDLACKYIPDCPETWKAITIHHLLTHTSGIPSYTGFPEFMKPQMMRVPLSPLEIVMLSKDKPLDFQPGEKMSYDNTGYVFLGAIIEKASGEKYADYIKKHIFEPLDMLDTGYDDTRTVLRNRASGYGRGPSGWQNADYLDMTLPHAAGSLYSTIGDLYRWDRSLYTDKVLSKKSREMMFTPFKNNYAYGWFVNQQFNHKQIGHGGGINGFNTNIARFPDDDAVVIVLSNTERGAVVARGVAGLLFGENVEMPKEYKAIKLDAKVLDQYSGTYQGPMTFTFTREGDRLFVEPKGQSKAEVFPFSNTEFFARVVEATFTFVPGDDGKAKEVVLNQNGGKMVAKRTN